MRRWSGFIRRELLILAILAGVAVAGFVTTRAMAAGDQRLRQRQAEFWFEAAQRELDGGNVERGLAALRRAALKDRDNREYRLVLGRTLAATGREDEATRLLFALRDEHPEDPEINLTLARVEASSGDLNVARRYYEAAIAALWRPQQRDRLSAVRLELIDLLLTRGERERALSQLLILSPVVSNQPPAHVAVGRRFLDAGDPARARQHFTRALEFEAKNQDALAGAGEAAFAQGDFRAASRYLAAVAAADDRIRDLHDVARLVLARDPLAPRLRAAERTRRLRSALERALVRIDACVSSAVTAPPAEVDLLRAEARTSLQTIDRRTASREQTEEGLHLVYRTERLAGKCSSPESLDRALLVIIRRHGLDEP